MYRSNQLSQRSTANTSLIYFLNEYKKFNQTSGKKFLGSKGRDEAAASKKSVEVTQANTTLFNLRMQPKDLGHRFDFKKANNGSSSR